MSKTNMKETLLKKIESREIVVGVVGLGYVGLPLAVEKAKAGFKTIGFDVQAKKVELVNAGHNYIGDVVDSDLEELVKAGTLTATTDFSFVKDVDFIAICVPTRGRASAAGYQLCAQLDRGGIEVSEEGYDGGTGIHDLSGNDGRID